MLLLDSRINQSQPEFPAFWPISNKKNSYYMSSSNKPLQNSGQNKMENFNFKQQQFFLKTR